jgi:hypothetical protein
MRDPVAERRILEMSHVLWSVVVPTAVFDLRSLLAMGDAFFPLFRLVTSSRVTTATPSMLLKQAAHVGAMRIVARIFLEHVDFIHVDAAEKCFVRAAAAGDMDLCRLVYARYHSFDTRVILRAAAEARIAGDAYTFVAILEKYVPVTTPPRGTTELASWLNANGSVTRTAQLIINHLYTLSCGDGKLFKFGCDAAGCLRARFQCTRDAFGFYFKVAKTKYAHRRLITNDMHHHWLRELWPGVWYTPK